MNLLQHTNKMEPMYPSYSIVLRFFQYIVRFLHCCLCSFFLHRMGQYFIYNSKLFSLCWTHKIISLHTLCCNMIFMKFYMVKPRYDMEGIPISSKFCPVCFTYSSLICCFSLRISVACI